MTHRTDGSAGTEPTPYATTVLSSLTRDFLIWLAREPRTYAETMEAWRTSCPRLTVWEDAIGDGLIRLDSGNGTRLRNTRVVLTPRGHSLLDGA